jgi:indolepyruvate ferredoxin oxidoreductase beta subunit
MTKYPEKRALYDAADSDWWTQLHAVVPAAVWPVVRDGIDWLVDYQDVAYARSYAQRLHSVIAPSGADVELLSRIARELAAWMAYEDIARIAQLELRRRPGEELQRRRSSSFELDTEHLMADSTELCRWLSPTQGRRLERVLMKRGLKFRLSLEVNGRARGPTRRLRLQLLSALRSWRPRTYGFHDEQRLMDAWLLRVCFALRSDLSLAREIAQCAELIRGRGAARQISHAALQRLCDAVIDPALDGLIRSEAAAVVRAARIAAAGADPLPGTRRTEGIGNAMGCCSDVGSVVSRSKPSSPSVS